MELILLYWQLNGTFFGSKDTFIQIIRHFLQLIQNFHSIKMYFFLINFNNSTEIEYFGWFQEKCLFSTLPVTRICQHASIVVISIINWYEKYIDQMTFSQRMPVIPHEIVNKLGKTPEDRRYQFYKIEILITILDRYCEWSQAVQIQCHGFLEYFNGN